jgi:hypothetical protein
MLETVKNYILGLLASAAGILFLLFYWEKSKASASEAVLEQAKVNADLDKLDEQAAANNAALQAEEAKRAALEKGTASGTPSLQDIANSLNNRK